MRPLVREALLLIGPSVPLALLALGLGLAGPGPTWREELFPVHVETWTGSGSRLVGLGDLDGDGKADAVVVDQFGSTITVRAPTRRPQTAGRGPLRSGSDILAAALGDTNGDGRTDLVAVLRSRAKKSQVTSLGIAVGTTGGTPGPVSAIDVPLPPLPTSIAVADLDSDGRPDLIVKGQAGQPLAILLARAGGFEARELALSYDAGAIAVADFDEDGALDLAIANLTAGGIEVHYGRGDGTFSASSRIATGTVQGELVAADLDGDDQPDLAGLGPAGVWVAWNLSTRAFQPVNVAVPAPAHLAVGDVDRDGRVDLIVAESKDPTLRVLLQTQPRAFAAPVAVGLLEPASGLAVGDLDGDGKLDVAVTQPTTNRISFFFGR